MEWSGAHTDKVIWRIPRLVMGKVKFSSDYIADAVVTRTRPPEVELVASS
jgi:hypothetical protein